jgi:hypothetical protein
MDRDTARTAGCAQRSLAQLNRDTTATNQPITIQQSVTQQQRVWRGRGARGCDTWQSGLGYATPEATRQLAPDSTSRTTLEAAHTSLLVKPRYLLAFSNSSAAPIKVQWYGLAFTEVPVLDHIPQSACLYRNGICGARELASGRELQARVQTDTVILNAKREDP